MFTLENQDMVLLAAGIEEFFTAAFMVIAFIGWIINLVGQNNQVKNRKQARPQGNANRQQQMQREMKEFLKQQRRQPQAERPVASEDVEVIEFRPPQRKRQTQQQRRRSKKEIWQEQVGKSTQTPRPSRQQQPIPISPPSATSRPGEELAKRQITSLIRESLEEQLDPTTAQRVVQAVKQDLPKVIDRTVSARLGQFSAGVEQEILNAARTREGGAQERNAALISLLRSKEGIRQGILVSEILSRPLASRHRLR